MSFAVASPNALIAEKTVVVTGTGVVCAAGVNTATAHASTLSGKRCPKPYPTLFDADFRKPVFECDLDFPATPAGGRTLELLLTALDEALECVDKLGGVDPTRIGVCVGTTVACMLNDLEFYSAVRSGGQPEITPLKRYVEGDLSALVAKRLGASGPVATVANACSSGTEAIATAARWLASGMCDIVVAAGADELHFVPYCGFNSLQVMSESFCLPFDGRRSGLNLGEGAGVLILETSESAVASGRAPLATLKGCGGGSDAYHITGPHPEGTGLKAAILMALDMASVHRNEVSYINAHGTATRDNDRVEAKAFHDFFGRGVPFASTKFHTGHALGAAGAIEAVLCVAGIADGRFPGNPGVEPDPEAPIVPARDVVEYNGGAVLSTSMAFGGSCSALVFGPPPEISATVSAANPADTPSIAIGVRGTGAVGPFGRGSKALVAGMEVRRSPAIDDGGLRIPPGILSDSTSKKLLRRAGGLSAAMVAAAKDTVAEAGLKSPLGDSTALVVTTAFGAHSATFAFLDGILDHGHSAPSPTQFSNSVHNSMAFFITKALDITGPSLTLTGFAPFAPALAVAESLMAVSKTIDRVLLVIGDEINPTFLKIAEMWREYRGEIHTAWGEGAVALLLERGAGHPLPDTLENAERLVPKIPLVVGKTLFPLAFALAGSWKTSKRA